MKQADLRDMFKKASKSVCTLTVVPPESLSPISSASSATKTPENKEVDTDYPTPADERHIQVEYFSH